MTHEELRKLAEAATPGPWEWLSFTSRNSYFPIMAENQKIMVCDAGFGKAEKATNNSAYIAAANPQQVIALLDEIAQLRAEVEQSKRDAESFEFKAQRLRNVVNMLGLEDAAPYSDEDLLGCMGSVLGIVRRGKEKEQEDDYVIKRLSGILAEISIALKGEELPLHSHGYHDLVELTQTNVLAIELYKHENTQRSERDKEVDEALLEYDATVFKDPARRNGNLPGETLKKIRKIWRGEK